MTAADRAAMRETLRAALGLALLPDATLEHPGVLPVPAAATPDALIERFRRELTALGGQVHEASETGEVCALIHLHLARARTHARLLSDHELGHDGLDRLIEFTAAPLRR